MHLLGMECLDLFDPIINCGGDKGYEENHGGNSLVNAEGKLVDEGDVISNGSLSCKVLKISDVFLKSIINGSIWEAGSLLNKFG